MFRETGNPHLSSEGNTEARQTALRKIMDSDPTLPDFSHLMKYPRTEGAYLGMQDMLETSLDRFHITSKPQVIAVIGHHASGKSTHIKLAIDYITRRTDIGGQPIKPVLVAYDSVIDVARQEKRDNQDAIDFTNLERLDPKLASGERDKDFYDTANHIFISTIKSAIAEGNKFIFIETPATKTADQKRPGLIFKDRGGAAIRAVSTGTGMKELDYNFNTVAIVADPELYLRNIRKRILKTKDNPGASIHGTLMANKELLKFMSKLLINKPPDQFTMSDIATGLVEFFEWELSSELLITQAEGAILKNTFADVPEVTKKDLAPYDFIKSASKGTVWEWLMTKKDNWIIDETI